MLFFRAGDVIFYKGRSCFSSGKFTHAGIIPEFASDIVAEAIHEGFVLNHLSDESVRFNCEMWVYRHRDSEFINAGNLQRWVERHLHAETPNPWRPQLQLQLHPGSAKGAAKPPPKSDDLRHRWTSKFSSQGVVSALQAVGVPSFDNFDELSPNDLAKLDIWKAKERLK